MVEHKNVKWKTKQTNYIRVGLHLMRWKCLRKFTNWAIYRDSQFSMEFSFSFFFPLVHFPDLVTWRVTLNALHLTLNDTNIQNKYSKLWSNNERARRHFEVQLGPQHFRINKIICKLNIEQEEPCLVCINWFGMSISIECLYSYSNFGSRGF